MIPISIHAMLLQSSPGGGSILLLEFGLIFLIFYFLMLRPQQKQRRQHDEALRGLRRGDQIVTSGGIVGEVIHIREGTKDGEPVRSMEDQVTIKTGDTRIIVERGRIARIAPRSSEVESS
ncbi:MAG TPA: preprotein translocase subunit YajC [Gemmatimonadaceae bacterium]|nr:preprotein translocase subunit YajC [Gemmatimonadaceae bacterium]